ncbi:uncharacterized protein YfaS (alpha-2-macroglobulin family) [Lewinella marina]|nr:alpha-2-macroglobulin family protein [Neolewinella marina]NJB84485.1 uncharacterized protein YfaS (alpha-2-macroglobulin family) [Neolewinella marina]
MHYLLILLLSALTGTLMAQDPTDTYRRIETLTGEGKYRSALTLADELYATAEAPDHRARALDYRTTLTGRLAEDGHQAAVYLLRQALADNARQPVVATVTHLLLGEYYHLYAESNAYRLSDLTTVGEAAVADTLSLTDYGMDQLLYLSHRHLYRALELARDNQTPLGAIPAIVSGGDQRIREVPTLYDLIVDRAMEVLGSSLGTVTDEALADAERALLPAEAFAALDLSLHYNLSKGTPRKLQLYQQWIAYHLDAGGPALLHADLERMRFVHRSGAPDSLYLAALQRMYDNYPGVDIRDRILVEMARLLDRDDEQLGARPRVRALRLLERVGEQDPVARVESRQLREVITQPVLEAQALSYYPRRQHLLVGLGYRNVDRVHYRIYAYDPARTEPDSYRSDERLAQVMRGRRVASGSQRLAPNDDYSHHRTELDLDPLPAGGYRMVIADNDDFNVKSSNFTIITFQVTDLATVKVDGTDDGAQVLVTDRTTGAAIPNVEVTVREQQRNGNYVEVVTRRTDAGGTLTLPATERYRSYQLILDHQAGRDRMVTEAYAFSRSVSPPRETFFTTLLPDRPIYRPGQTVHVYGLRYRKGGDELPSVVPNATVTVVLRDANYQEVASQEATADAYGRFSLDFTLPTGGLTGEFTLQTEQGNANIRVEEYKRPRFAVELETPPAVQPGAVATVEGTALTYAGPPVAEGRVSYRVYLEEVRWFYSYFRGGGGGGGDRELLTSGTTETDAGGAFTFTFATRDNLNTAGFRRYRYVVEADVADPTGETHEATTTVAIRGQRPTVAVTPQRETIDRGDSLKLLVATDAADTSLRLQLRIVPVIKPNAALLEREWPMPDRPVINRAAFERNHPYLAYAPVPELSTWPTRGEAVYSTTVELDGAEVRLPLRADFPVGHYRIEFTYPDGTAGVPATFSVYSSANNELPLGVLYELAGAPDTVTVGQPLNLRLISAVDLPLVLHQWQSRAGTTSGRAGGGRSLSFTYTPTEADRGGLSVELAFIRLNRLHRTARQLSLPWDNKELTATYATFRNRLRPGVPEEWTIVLRNADGSSVEAAALATMYDASLDQVFAGQGWEFAPYPRFYGGAALIGGGSFGTEYGRSYTRPGVADRDTIPTLPRLRLAGDRLQEVVMTGMGRAARFRGNVEAMAMESVAAEAQMDMEKAAVTNQSPPPPPAPGDTGQSGARPPVNLRTKLQETAFWFPALTAGNDGSLRISFESPEALTAWKFRLFVHDAELNYVLSEREVVTQKELMVLPNVPRFLREGDSLTLTARVANMTDAAMPVDVYLELFDPATDEVLDLAAFGGAAGARELTATASLEAQASATVRFPLVVPEGLSERGVIGYRIVGRGATFSDGEENVVPVLSDRTLITVSVPYYLRRNDRKTITLPLLADYDSESLRHVGYVFEATTNPAWLALKALPYLMEYPYDCTEQVVNRYFAHRIAYTTVTNKPVLERVFRRWQADSTALLGELQRNESLTQALLTETPWVREAQSETEQRARLAHLFDLKKLAEEQRATLAKLVARQESDGAYSWFPGGPSDRYMTQYVVETLARMRQLGVVDAAQSATVNQITERALAYLDERLTDDYRRLFADVRDSVELRNTYRPSALQVHQLYARAMSGTAAGKATPAVEFYRERALDSWTDYGLYEQALIALVADAHGDGTAKTILESLRERALHADEFGMYWKYPRGFQWHNLPLETHTRLLEAFGKIDPRQEELDGMRLWLLSNKRTNRWPTTKATAAAVFALLNGGEQYRVEDEARPLVASWPGLPGNELGTRVRALQQEAETGTGAFTLRLPAGEVTRDHSTVKLRNRGNDLVWGGVHWQYTELADRVEASADGPLSLERQLFKRDGDRLSPLAEGTTLQPGDRVTVRLTLSSDRDLDYVHLKDRRAATFEPVNALSSYTYSGGLGYYFAPGDVATNFFIDHLPRGTYTLEYDLFTTYAGNFSNGLGRVECMYAPEFGGNSEGGRVLVR